MFKKHNQYIDVDPNFYHPNFQGMQQPYPPYPEQKPSILSMIIRMLKHLFILWLILTAYGIFLTEGNSWSEKAFTYFEQMRQQQLSFWSEQNSSK